MRHVVRIAEERTPFRALMCHLVQRRLLDRPRRQCVDNIEHDVRNVGLGQKWTERVTKRIERREMIWNLKLCVISELVS